MKPRLLASAGTLAGIERLVIEFYAGTRYVIEPETLTIARASDGYVPEGVRVREKAGRYRFELVDA